MKDEQPWSKVFARTGAICVPTSIQELIDNEMSLSDGWYSINEDYSFERGLPKLIKKHCK